MTHALVKDSDTVASTGEQRQRSDLQRMILYLLVPLLPVTTIGASTLSAGAALGLALAPLAVPAALKFRGAKGILALWALCLITGPVLASITASELSRSLNQRLEVRLLLLVLNAGVTLYVLLWARGEIGARTTAVLYSIGLIAEGVLGQAASTAENPWKYAFALPAAVLLLSIPRTRTWSFCILGMLAALSIWQHSRSFAAICLLAAVAVLMAPRLGQYRKKKINARTIALTAISAVGVYMAVSHALLNGWFGSHLQHQAVAQTRDGEVTLLIGARPEWAAAFKLFEIRPVGFGPGVVPNSADVSTGLAGLIGLGVNREGRYVQDYLFGNRLEVHSVIGDLWLLFGFVGLGLALTILWHLTAGIFTVDASSAAGAIGIIVAFVALWDMAFSPVSNLRYVVLALALLLPLRDHAAKKSPQIGSAKSLTGAIH